MDINLIQHIKLIDRQRVHVTSSPTSPMSVFLSIKPSDIDSGVYIVYYQHLPFYSSRSLEQAIQTFETWNGYRNKEWFEDSMKSMTEAFSLE